MTMDHEDKSKLLSEEEWLRLMNQAYEAEGAPLDKVAKERVWLQLRQKTSERPRPLLATWAALAAGFLAVIGIAKFLAPLEDSYRIKGPSATAIPLVLEAYVLDADGTTHPVNQALPAGTTVVFRAHATRQGVYAIMLAENASEAPFQESEGERIGVSDELLRKNGQVFGLSLAAGAPTRVCVVAADDRAALQTLLADLPALRLALTAEHCVVLRAMP